ncbi:sigma factor [Pseudonocardia sp. NPDC049154]|uniref:RNA polymerase sigma factor n=1 Tax=Pseudonocardia sp. NPDC049154 TaxID=3155501 RepID=UPI0034115296
MSAQVDQEPAPADPEESAPDGVVADGATPEGATPDDSTSDGSTPDSSTPGGSTPGGSTPDSAADGSVVERDLSAESVAPSGLRADFGAHLEAHYPRLVGQLFAITLDSGTAHDLVQDAYSRAWRRWSEIREGDAEAWVRRVAVRSSASTWRRLAARLGLRGAPVQEQAGLDPRTAAVLRTLARVPADERRTAVLVYMAGMGVREVAALERVSPGTVQARLNRVGSLIEEGVAGLAALGSVPLLPPESGERAGHVDSATVVAVPEAPAMRGDGADADERSGGDAKTTESTTESTTEGADQEEAR